MSGKQTPIREQATAADERVSAALSILQLYIHAEDTALDASRMWGTRFIPMFALEQAARLLIDALDDIDELECRLATAPKSS